MKIEDQHENLISTLRHRQLLQEESLSHDRTFNSWCRSDHSKGPVDKAWRGSSIHSGDLAGDAASIESASRYMSTLRLSSKPFQRQIPSSEVPTSPITAILSGETYCHTSSRARLSPPSCHSRCCSTNKKVDRLVRQYHDDEGKNDDDEVLSPKDDEWPSGGGWSAEELERQDQLFQAQDSQYAQEVDHEQAWGSASDHTNMLFKEIDSIPTPTLVVRDSKSKLPKFNSDPESDHIPLIGGSLETHILSMWWLSRPVSDTYHPEISTERHAALDAFRVIVSGNLDDKRQQALDIFKNNNLSELVDPTELTRYLYQSTERTYLEEILTIDPRGPLAVATLCRLGRLEEASELAIRRLDKSDSPSLCMEVLLVMESYAYLNDWQNLIKVWEAGALSPSIRFPNQLLSEQTRNVIIENCLFTIPNVKEWFFAKYKEIYTSRNGPRRRRRQWIKNFLGILVKAFANNNDWATAKDLIQFQIRVFQWVNQNTLFEHMVGLRVNGQPKEAVEMYLQYRNNEFSPVIHPTERNEEVDRSLALRIQNEAMASASLLNNFPVLQQIFEDVYTLGLEPDHYSYAIVMHAFARHGQKKEVETLYDTFIKSGRETDIFMYAELLYVNVTLLDIPGVERVFEMIKKSKFDPNLVIYDMSTMAYTRTLDVENSMRMFQEFIRAGNKPNTQIIGHLISMFAYRHDTEGAVEMFNLVGEFGLSPTTGLFNQLLNAYAVAGDSVNAEAVIVKMREVDVRPDVITWTTLMKLYVEKHDTYLVVDTLARMRRSGCEPDQHTWAQLMQSFARDGGKNSLDNCRRIMRRMEAVGQKATVHHWNNLLEATAVNTGDMELMQRVYDEMLDKNSTQQFNPSHPSRRVL